MKSNMTLDWFEIRRKTFHILLGIVLVLLTYYDVLSWWITAIILALGVMISFACMTIDIPGIHWFLNKFERENHRRTFPGKGVIFLFIALFILELLFKKNITIASILIWTFGDSVSAIVGTHYGRYPHPMNSNRFIEGTIAGIIAATIASSFFVNVFAAFAAAFIAMTLESLEMVFLKNPVDDNLLVPMVSAIILVLLIG